MKRKCSVFALCMVLICMMILPAAAASPLVLDYANLLITEEEAYLRHWCGEIGSKYNVDVVLLTVPTMMDNSAQSFADDFYENNGYSENGLIFLLDMGSRQWHISTAGTAIEMLSDRDLERIEDKVILYFSDGAYFDGFCQFLEILPGHLAVETDGGVNLMVSMLIGAIIAAIVIVVMRSTMNTKNPQRSAINYETDGSYHLRTHQDLFLYSNISKRPRPQNNSSGSSTHRSSSGTIHGGRGGRF